MNIPYNEKSIIKKFEKKNKLFSGNSKNIYMENKIINGKKIIPNTLKFIIIFLNIFQNIFLRLVIISNSILLIFLISGLNILINLSRK